jgi:hypothetical protein
MERLLRMEAMIASITGAVFGTSLLSQEDANNDVAHQPLHSDKSLALRDAPRWNRTNNPVIKRYVVIFRISLVSKEL